jgi:hypothetical protein
MTLKTLSVKKKSDQKQNEYFVYFDEWTGSIKAITNKVKPTISHPYLITKQSLVGDIMKGVENRKKYIVAELVDGFKLIQKDNYLRLKKAENYLSKIQENSLTSDSDVNVVVYLSDYKVEVNVSSDILYKLTGKMNPTDVVLNKSNDYDKISLYITEKNNPMRLLETIEIDPVELFERGYMLYDFSHLRSVIQLGNIDILTKRIFKSYSLKIKQNYVKPDYGFRLTNKRNHISIYDSSFEDYTTFTISDSTKGWIIKSNFSNPAEHKIYKDIKIFLTTDNPFELLDKIVIPLDSIGQDKEYLIETKIDPSKCKILVGEEGKNISFKLEEI